MKILIHGNAPWPSTAYAIQARIWARKFRELGHDVVLSAFAGLSGATMPWDGFRVLPSAFNGDPFGAGILPVHARRENADLVLTLCDVWALNPVPLRGLPLACWAPVDCAPLGSRDEQCLRESGAVPIAMSRFGERQMRDAGFDPLYVPHGIDLGAFRPSISRDQARRQLNVDGKFVIGMNATNKDACRKGYAEQFSAFARLHAAHPDAVLLVHALIAEEGSLNLRSLEQRLGIEGAVRYVDQYSLLTGQISEEHMVNWYAALDLYSACSLGEGFCIPVVEALACGVPVVATDASTGPELVGEAGWLVGGEPFWNPTHESWWLKPAIGAIHEVYETAYLRGSEYLGKKSHAAAAAAPYSVDRVLAEHWIPALEMLQERFCSSPPAAAPAPPGPRPAVSVCFASRGRASDLVTTVSELRELAADPERVEILVAVDPDDEATLKATSSWPRAGESGPVRVWVAPERFGYQRLHDYLNPLAGMAAGDWVMWWNDDMRMKTAGWDTVIREHRPAVLWPKANHVGHANIAPAWPRAWSQATGRVSPTTHMDTYLQRLGEALQRHDPVPIEIVHDRFDVTGGHGDTTYEEGRALLGPEGMVDEPFPYGQVAIDAARIRALLA